MYVIVVGCGKIGYYLTRALLASNNEVVVIERDSRRSEMAADEFGSIMVASDGTEPTVLREAGAGSSIPLAPTIYLSNTDNRLL